MIDPDNYYSIDWHTHADTLERFLGRRASLWVLRGLSFILVLWSGWLVAHESLALVGR